MEIRFILIPIDERCKRRRHQQSCSPKQKQRQTETERAFRRRRKKGGFDSLALSHSQFSSQCYSFLRALWWWWCFLLRRVSDAFTHITRNTKTRRKLSFRVSNPNNSKSSFLFSLSSFSLQRARALRVARASFRIVYTELYTHKNVDKIRNEIEPRERPLVPPETAVDFSLVTFGCRAIVGLPNGNADRPIRRTRRTGSWGGFSHQPTAVRFRGRRL